MVLALLLLLQGMLMLYVLVLAGGRLSLLLLVDNGLLLVGPLVVSMVVLWELPMLDRGQF
jgi:hypothetical protein